MNGEEPRAGTRARTDEASVAAARKWILVADDDHAVRRLLTKVLESAGYRVVLARDGLEAGELIRDVQPHLAILDLRMPRMSGSQFLEAARGIPVLVLSGYLGDLSPEAAARTNIVGLLEKPVDLEVLRTRVRDALRDGNP